MKFNFYYNHKHHRLTLIINKGDFGAELSFEALDDTIQENPDVKIIEFVHNEISQSDLFSFVNYLYKVYPGISIII